MIILAILFVISNCKGNDTEWNFAQTLFNLNTSPKAEGRLNIEHGSKFEIGESSKLRGIPDLNEMPVSEEEDEAESSVCPNGMKLEYKSSEEGMGKEECFSDELKLIERKTEDEMTDEDDGEGGCSRSKIYQYVAVGPDQSAIIHEIQTYCEECDKHLSSINNYESHAARDHPKKKIFPCNYGGCLQGFTRFCNFYQHQFKFHGLRYRKNVPPNIPSNVQKIQKIRKASINVVLENWKEYSKKLLPTYCQECRLECYTANSLERHARLYHPSRRLFPCPVANCCSAYTQTTNLTKHLNEKHGREKKRRRYDIVSENTNCPFCDRKFSNAKSLYAHAKERHPSEKLLSCSFCSAMFNEKGNKNRHERSIHGSGRGGAGIYCKYCNREFRRWDYLPKHEATCMNKLQERKPDDADVFECQVCDKTYPKNRLNSFKYHKNGHKKYVRCPICNRGFAIKRGPETIQLHIYVHHLEKWGEIDFNTLCLPYGGLQK